MSGPAEIPTGAVLRCSCGVTVADLDAWEGHQNTHDGEPSWELIDAHTSEPIER